MAASGDPLIDLDMVSGYARSPEGDDVLEGYVLMAQGIVINRLEQATTDTEVLATIAGWDEDTVPDAIKAAILTQFMELYRFRGDDEFEIRTTAPGRLSDRVERFLGPWLERPVA